MSGEIRFPIVGNLTADPELRRTASGLSVAGFTIASTPRVPDGQSGQMKDGEPVFMRCTAWRDLAEHLAASLTKGTRVVAFGRYRQRRYETETGEKRTSHEFEVDAIGPDLRWATAVVTRTSGSPSHGQPAGLAEWAEPPADESGPWGEETPF